MARVALEILIIMVEYGKIEDGYLRIREIEPIITRQQNADGTITEVVLTVEEQVALLPTGWKPVDPMDENSMQSNDPDYIVVAVPYDNGDRISYRYEKRFDYQRIKQQVAELKRALADSDYKVMKCYEATMLGHPLPYDIDEVHAQRQAMRDKINELEPLLPQIPSKVITL